VHPSYAGYRVRCIGTYASAVRGRARSRPALSNRPGEARLTLHE
jgi:hypothetical protein